MTDEVFYELRAIGKASKGPVAPRQPDPRDEARKQAAEDGRAAAARFANEALERVVALMRQSNDPQVILKCATLVINRAWGNTKPTAESDKAAIGAGNSIIDILAGASAQGTALLEAQQAVPAPVAPVLQQDRAQNTDTQPTDDEEAEEAEFTEEDASVAELLNKYKPKK